MMKNSLEVFDMLALFSITTSLFNMSLNEGHIEEQESERRFEEGCKKYEELLKFAKANLKGIRKGMRKDTIIKKLNDAGIEYVW